MADSRLSGNFEEVVEGQTGGPRGLAEDATWRPGTTTEAYGCVTETCEAVVKADVIVAGPGSLYTSILPPLLVPDLRQALVQTTATRLRVRRSCTPIPESCSFA